MNLQEQLFKAIELLIDAKTQNIPYNTCIEGIILDDKPQEDGSYPFDYQGQTFYAFPLSNTQVIKKGEWVYVLIIGNDFSGKKIILTSKAKEDNQPNIYNEIAKLQTGINYLKNIIPDQEYVLYCNKTEEQIIPLDYDENLLKVAMFGEYIKLSYEIESDLNENDINGDYGLRIEFSFNDNSTQIFDLSLNDIMGNPYKTFGKKYRILPLPVNTYPTQVNKVEFYLKGFSVDNNKYVKFKNPRIEFVDDAYVDIIRELPYNLVIESTNGTIFKDNIGSTILKARVYYGGVDITNNLSNNQFKWRRVSKNTEADAIWNSDIEKSVGKEIIVNAQDFDDEATFYCELVE